MSPAARSVESREVDQFERLGEDWWDTRGPMRALHRMNPLRVEWIRAHVAERFGAAADASAPRRVLDVGCGGGLLAESLARLGFSVTAIDPAPGSIEVARRHASLTGLAIDYRVSTIEEIVAAGETFDVVCAMEVLEHVNDPRVFVADALAATKPDGLFFAATLNRTAKSFALGIVAAEFILRWAPKGTHQWEKFITPDELEAWVESGGAAVIERRGVVYDIARDRWKTSSDTGVNYMMAARRDA